jgi:hypothetical protein
VLSHYASTVAACNKLEVSRVVYVKSVWVGNSIHPWGLLRRHSIVMAEELTPMNCL